MLNLIKVAQAVSASDLNFNFQLIPRSTSVLELIATGINALLLLVGAIAVIYFIYGGMIYITAGGDAEKATKGRTVLVNAIIGIVIILAALVITSWVRSSFTG